jgi:hypothetical protein
MCSVDSLYTQLKPFTYKPPMITKAEYPLVVDVAPRLTFSRRDSRSLGLGRGLSVRGGGICVAVGRCTALLPWISRSLSDNMWAFFTCSRMTCFSSGGIGQPRTTFFRNLPTPERQLDTSHWVYGVAGGGYDDAHCASGLMRLVPHTPSGSLILCGAEFLSLGACKRARPVPHVLSYPSVGGGRGARRRKGCPGDMARTAQVGSRGWSHTPQVGPLYCVGLSFLAR